jgi:hypothetical protein
VLCKFYKCVDENIAHTLFFFPFSPVGKNVMEPNNNSTNNSFLVYTQKRLKPVSTYTCIKEDPDVILADANFVLAQSYSVHTAYICCVLYIYLYIFIFIYQTASPHFTIIYIFPWLLVGRFGFFKKE